MLNLNGDIVQILRRWTISSFWKIHLNISTKAFKYLSTVLCWFTNIMNVNFQQKYPASPRYTKLSFRPWPQMVCDSSTMMQMIITEGLYQRGTSPETVESWPRPLKGKNFSRKSIPPPSYAVSYIECTWRGAESEKQLIPSVMDVYRRQYTATITAHRSHGNTRTCQLKHRPTHPDAAT